MSFDDDFEHSVPYQRLLNAPDAELFPLMAHEMLKPLNLLMGYADLVLHGADPALLDEMLLEDEHTALSMRFMLELVLKETALLQQLIVFMRDHQQLRGE